MVNLRNLLFSCLIILFSSCKDERGYTYAIKDSRKSLQPFLIEIASKGIVTYHDSAKIKSITDKELMLLGRAENPVIRSTAFREMLQRTSFDHFDLIMNHLDDTAVVATDAGEFGTWYRKVSDDILQEATWKTEEAKQKTIDRVLTKHNYLKSAYTILNILEPQEKYYPYIKDMATRPRRLDGDYELDFDDIEYALYGLAKFKKPGDVKIIKEKMMNYAWELGDESFRLMQEFPDTAYFEVLQTYHRRSFYRFSGNRPGGFTGVYTDRASPEAFIRALAIQQTDKSAKLLDTMLTWIPMQTCMPGKKNILEKVIMEIWEHPCPAYAKLREKIRPKAEEISKGILIISTDELPAPIDTTERIIRWY